MTSAKAQSGQRGAIWRPRQRAHWWLASVLVGCLLPAGLLHAEALRLAERLTQVYLMAPEAIRAESRRVARVAAKRPVHPQAAAARARRSFYVEPAISLSAALDVISRRGPPVSA
ncbi:hypothetical protein BTW08_14000 [Salinicola sp. MH3R3-1]|uniref:hypothetical protein n=1 Tax=Salinicola TaxID=404432 RepID=UPI00094E012E|nr:MULTISPECIES: hypothetical protein [Salinicola]OLO07128.1 hypothetical protein BTW08_14000 [Salinicola sp. MH3R3-1]